MGERTVESVARELRELVRDGPNQDEPWSITTARYVLRCERAALERAADVAWAHRGEAARNRKANGGRSLAYLDEESRLEIVSYERGEDIGAERITAKLRRLAAEIEGEGEQT